MSPPSQVLLDAVERCIVAFERDGEDALQAELLAAGERAPEARKHVDALRAAGLLHPPELPERIGSWRIVKRLGSGGMGTVFLGEQTDPITRRAAIKVIRAGTESHEILARFAIERQALALLDHPGIARVLDAGQTTQGRPYLVMDYVEGRAIHAHCDAQRLDTRQRLELFAQVCDAVQHAHHKGLIHRDLKPSNILVGERDGRPFPVVIDFGVAKSVGARLGLATVTLPGHLLGTPEYMSPEQAKNLADVDTRTDVYSLGVVLYELLTGTLPIDGKQLRAADPAHVLANTDPPTPSTRITKLGEHAAAVAQHRGTSVPALRRSLRGDLDWIVMKALERDRDRRYGMPGEFAADVRRHLRNEPVTAGAPSPWYRFTKYCARHRLQVTAAAIVLGTLAAGLGTSIVFWRDAQASAADATAGLDAALVALGELVQVGDSDLVTVPHLEDVRRDLLQRSVAAYRDFLARATIDDPRLLERTLDAMTRLGNMQAQLGEEDDALRHLLEARQLLATPRAVALLPAATRTRTERDVLLDLARIREKRHQFADALTLVREATPLARSLHGETPDASHTKALALALDIEAGLHRASDPARALALLDEAIALVEANARAQPDDPATVAQRMTFGVRRADVLRLLGRPEECSAAVATLRELRATDARANSWPLILATLPLLDLMYQCGKANDVHTLAAELQPELERLHQNHPTIVPYRMALTSLWNVRSNAELTQQGFGAALQAQGVAQKLSEDGLALAPANAPLRRQLIISLLNVAVILQEQRRTRGECDEPAVEQALQRAMDLLDTMPNSGTSRQVRLDRLEALSQRARMHDARHDAARARADYEAAIALAVHLAEESPDAVTHTMQIVDLRRRHGALLLAAGEVAAALAQLEETLRTAEGLDAHSLHAKRQIGRRRDLLLLLLRARGETGDLDGAFAALDRHLQLGVAHDWLGRNLAITALTQLLARVPVGDARMPRVLARGREIVTEALAYEAGYRERGTGHGTLAVMRGTTQALARDLEDAADERAAAATLASATVASYAESWRDGATPRAESRLLEAIEAEARLLQCAGDPGALAAARDRAHTLFAADTAARARVDAAFATAGAVPPGAANGEK